jgi:hypothetical protein
MKQFLTKIAIILLLSVLILEVMVRALGLGGITIPEENINNNVLFLRNFSGTWTKGGFSEIKSTFHINNQGWNSIVDFDSLKEEDYNIAIIGDSYIEGFHENIETSIGRRLEKFAGDSLVAHEYGHSGGNINDYILVYKEIENKPYDKIIVLLTNSDLLESKAKFMGRGKDAVQLSTLRKVYNEIAFLRYLNINQGLIANFGKILETADHSPRQTAVTEPERINFDFFVFDKSKVVFIYESNKFNPAVLISQGYNCKEIKHELSPYTFGFDNHWNTDGRINCAKSIYEAIYLTK